MRFTEEEVGRFIKITQMQLAGGGRKKKVKEKKVKKYTVYLTEVVRTWVDISASSKKQAIEYCAGMIKYVLPLDPKQWKAEEEKNET